MKKNNIIYLGILIAIVALTSAQSIAQSRTSTRDSIRQIFLKTVDHAEVYSSGFLLHSDELNLHEGFTSGEGKGVIVNSCTPYYTASITKTLTATAIAMLVDDGLLSFDDRMYKYLPRELVEGLHVYDGYEYSREITIDQLLSHQSGLPDYWEDEPTSGSNMMGMLFEKPDYFWQPEELIPFTRENFKAKFAPGTGYHYSDTEYVLLGLIIQRLANMPLHEFFMTRIFQPLEMNSSWMHLRSEAIDASTPTMAGFYFGSDDLSGLTSLSADWAGGGLVSTSGDLLRFMSGLNNGQLVSEATLERMQQWVPESYGTSYGYGLRKWELKSFSPSLGDLTLIGHSGTSSAYMYYCPELDTYFTGTFNQINFMEAHIKMIIEMLAQVSAYAQSERSGQ